MSGACKENLISIAVDGPVGAGKSSLCDAVASALAILHLDTGAMYRAIGLYALDQGISPDDEDALARMIAQEDARVSVDFQNGQQVTLLNGVDVTGRLREEAVGKAASAVSKYAVVRKYLVRLQQQIAKERSLLIDGRDIGTVVLPDAKVKIFLTASAEDRAMRRYKQLLDAGKGADYQKVLTDLKARDDQDQNRAVDPLRPADDAVILDTTGLSFEESLQKMLDIVNKAYEC
ncbi:MAG: (d)CMP kinase [Christensenellales bacterium]|jgi:cytidylate kinase|nr:(d)CMP kinase [Clostridiales bacterium]